MFKSNRVVKYAQFECLLVFQIHHVRTQFYFSCFAEYSKMARFQGPTLTYYKNYNFETEPWWPKFEQLRSKYGIVVAKGEAVRQAKKTKAATTRQQQPQEQSNLNDAWQQSASSENLHTSNYK